MKLKLFGKDLFEIKKSTKEAIYNTAIDKLKNSDFLIDFYKETGGSAYDPRYEAFTDTVIIENPRTGKAELKKITKGKKQVKEKLLLTPKGVHHLKLLHDETFAIKTDPAYVDEQLQQFKDKLDMIKVSEFDMNRGTIEIGSIVSRLENRKKYAKHEAFYSQFPYTTPATIADLVKKHDHLKLGEVAQFLADMPQDAVDVMKQYTKETKSLCDKKPIFYIIADKKDFQKSEKRRDPILLAQSPFGHCWQILGAWDEEMVLVDEL